MTTTTEERERLEQAERAVKSWMTVLREQASKLDERQVENFAETMRRLLTRLNKDLGPLDIEPEALSEIRGVMLEGIEKIDEEAMEPIDVLDDLLVRAEQIRHVIRDALDADLGLDARDARALSQALIDWLPGMSQREIANLVGISLRQLQRWLRDGGVAPRRLRLVAQLVVLLRRAWSPEGVVAWFARPRRDLGGRAPIALLDDPAEEPALRAAVRRGRAQHGA
jgi:transcriptional regulator with XRE-family HTH domain